MSLTNQINPLVQVKNQKTDAAISNGKLVLMWLLIFLGYFIFVIQWYSIGNFQAGATVTGGWGQAFFAPGTAINPLANSAPNWTITLGRAIGSILAGYWIAKLGHKYAVMVVLAFMVIAFPYIIVAQNAGWNSLSIAGGANQTGGIAVAGYSLFVIFRIFLAIGGTTLISYTNSVIAKMNQAKRPLYMTLNQFAFNGGAFISNIFFISVAVRNAVVATPLTWSLILGSFVAISAVLLVVFYFVADNVVPKVVKGASFEQKQFTLKEALLNKRYWGLYWVFGIWLLAAVFVNTGTLWGFITRSPVNALLLATEGGANYAWILRAYVCVFVAGFIVAYFTISKFTKTIFARKMFISAAFILGYISLLIGMLSVYFGGLNNSAAVAVFLLFSFIGGIFIWGIQPVLLSIGQQVKESNAQFVGVLAGVIWGVGYLVYTIFDASFSSIASYGGINNSTIMVADNQMKTVVGQTPGFIAMFVLMWIALASVLVGIYFIPKTGYWKGGEFVEFEKTWNPLNFRHWNLSSKEWLPSIN